MVLDNPPSADTAPPGDAAKTQAKILYLGGAGGTPAGLREAFGDDVDVVPVESSQAALPLLHGGDYAGVYVAAERLSDETDVGRLLQNDLILQSMSDGIVLLDAEGVILWGNGRLREWIPQDCVAGKSLFAALGNPEVLGSDPAPLRTALATRKPTGTTVKCVDGRHFRIHAAPMLERDAAPQHLVVTVQDVTPQIAQQQKLEAIHHAGTQLADLVPEDVADLDYEQRVDLLKDNILHCMKDVLHLDVIEIRMLESETRELIPLLAYGMDPAAAQRRLFAEKEGNGVTGYVAATGKSYLCGNAAEDPRYLEGAKGARSSLTVPLSLHEGVIGTLNVESPDLFAFTASDQQFLEIFARNVAFALNTLELLAAQTACTAAQSIEQIHSKVALPIDDILNEVVNILEHAEQLPPESAPRLQKILISAREIKRVIQEVGQSLAPVEAFPAPTPAEEHPTLSGLRILVVDANKDIRSSAHDLLERYQCFVETAHHGVEACSMVRNLGPDHYDVIFVETLLPDMTAYEFMMKLRAITGETPMVLTAEFGWDLTHTQVKCRREGLKHAIIKPFRLEQMVDTIEKMVVDRRRAAATA